MNGLFTVSKGVLHLRSLQRYALKQLDLFLFTFMGHNPKVKLFFTVFLFRQADGQGERGALSPMTTGLP